MFQPPNDLRSRFCILSIFPWKAIPNPFARDPSPLPNNFDGSILIYPLVESNFSGESWLILIILLNFVKKDFYWQVKMLISKILKII